MIVCGPTLTVLQLKVPFQKLVPVPLSVASSYLVTSDRFSLAQALSMPACCMHGACWDFTTGKQLSFPKRATRELESCWRLNFDTLLEEMLQHSQCPESI